MNVHVKFNSSELAGKLRSGEYSLPDRSTIYDLIEVARQEAEVVISEELRGNLVFLLNDRHAAIDTMLSDGSKLRVLHKVLGGA